MLEVDRLKNWFQKKLGGDYDIVAYYNVVEQLETNVLDPTFINAIIQRQNSLATYEGVLTMQSTPHLVIETGTAYTAPFTLQIRSQHNVTTVEDTLKTLISNYNDIQTYYETLTITKTANRKVSNVDGTVSTDADYDLYTIDAEETKIYKWNFDETTNLTYAWYNDTDVFISGGADVSTATAPTNAVTLKVSNTTATTPTLFRIEESTNYKLDFAFNEPVISQIIDGESQIKEKVIQLDGSVTITNGITLSGAFTFTIDGNEVKNIINATPTFNVAGKTTRTATEPTTHTQEITRAIQLQIALDMTNTLHASLMSLTMGNSSDNEIAFVMLYNGSAYATWSNAKIIGLTPQMNKKGSVILQLNITKQ